MQNRSCWVSPAIAPAYSKNWKNGCTIICCAPQGRKPRPPASSTPCASTQLSLEPDPRQPASTRAWGAQNLLEAAAQQQGRKPRLPASSTPCASTQLPLEPDPRHQPAASARSCCAHQGRKPRLPASTTPCTPPQLPLEPPSPPPHPPLCNKNHPHL